MCTARLSTWGPSLTFLVVWVGRAATLRCRVSYEILTLPPPVESLPLRTEGQAGGFSSGTLGRQPAIPLLVRPRLAARCLPSPCPSVLFYRLLLVLTLIMFLSNEVRTRVVFTFPARGVPGASRACGLVVFVKLENLDIS